MKTDDKKDLSQNVANSKDEKDKVVRTVSLVRPCKVIVWAQQQAGMSVQDSADSLGLCTRSINRYRADMVDYMANEMDINVLRRGIYGLLSDAMRAMKTLLFVADSPATIAFFKGMGLFIDKSEVKSDSNNAQSTTTDKLRSEVIELVGEAEGQPKTKTG